MLNYVPVLTDTSHTQASDLSGQLQVSSDPLYYYLFNWRGAAVAADRVDVAPL